MEQRSFTDPKVINHFDIKDIPANRFLKDVYLDIPGITMVFDLEGSSASIRQRGARDFVDVHTEVFNNLTTIIYKREGIIEKFPGDGISAHFLAPPTPGDNIEDGLALARAFAVDALLEIRRYMIMQNQSISYRVVLWSGKDTIATQIGNDFHTEVISVGDGVNTAHKLEKEVKNRGCRFGMDSFLKDSYLKRSPSTAFVPHRLPSDLRTEENSFWYGIE